MARRILMTALLGAALSLTACTPKYPKCDNDEHCKEKGEVCVNGTCQECGKDQDCKEGFVCTENKCTPKAECQAAADCGEGRKCEAGKCVAECVADADCQGGFKCQAGRCAPAPECLSDADCAQGTRCDPAGKCVAAAPEGCPLETVYFEYNQFNLTGEARNALDKSADCLKKTKTEVTLAGHADERGTEEYNLHLGEKRANSVKKYLVALGVAANRLKTVSYGEERPASTGSNESAWAQNRRVELSER